MIASYRQFVTRVIKMISSTAAVVHSW